MESETNTKGRWWHGAIRCTIIYVVLATIAFGIYTENRLEAREAIMAILLGFLIAFIGCLVGGIILLLHRERDWGWMALGVAIYIFFFLGFALPMLARVKN